MPCTFLCTCGCECLNGRVIDNGSRARIQAGPAKKDFGQRVIRREDGLFMSLFQWFGWSRSVRSQVLSFYKRGLARTKNDDSKGALVDFTSVIELADAPSDVRAMAQYNRALLYAAAGDIGSAVADLNAVLNCPEPLREIKLAAKRRLERMHTRTPPDSSAAHPQNTPVPD
jgi:hypothetical protein